MLQPEVYGRLYEAKGVSFREALPSSVSTSSVDGVTTLSFDSRSHGSLPQSGEVESTEMHADVLSVLQPHPARPPPDYAANPNRRIRYPIYEREETHELPAYAPAVHKVALVSVKQEWASPYEPAVSRSWRTLLMELNSTQLNFYHVDEGLLRGLRGRAADSTLGAACAQAVSSLSFGQVKPGTLLSLGRDERQFSPAERQAVCARAQREPERHLSAERLYKSYSLQYATFGVPIDYTKRPFVLRLRCETEQFLVCFATVDMLINWSVALSVGIGVSLDLEHREMPAYRTVPRRRRCRRRRHKRTDNRSRNPALLFSSKVSRRGTVLGLISPNVDRRTLLKYDQPALGAGGFSNAFIAMATRAPETGEVPCDDSASLSRSSVAVEPQAGFASRLKTMFGSKKPSREERVHRSRTVHSDTDGTNSRLAEGLMDSSASLCASSANLLGRELSERCGYQSTSGSLLQASEQHAVPDEDQMVSDSSSLESHRHTTPLHSLGSACERSRSLTPCGNERTPVESEEFDFVETGASSGSEILPGDHMETSIYEDEGIYHSDDDDDDDDVEEDSAADDTAAQDYAARSRALDMEYRRRAHSAASSLSFAPYGYSFSREKWTPAVKENTRRRFVRDSIRCIRPLCDDDTWLGALVVSPTDASGPSSSGFPFDLGLGSKRLGSRRSQKRGNQSQTSNRAARFMKAYIVGPVGLVASINDTFNI
ncbi:AaceriAFR049Wp [[Ashbya] aceris (nom. inval.)]|nr:AaceriAFR049Wp [[Ashbya] aceris (nom. inval.)]